LSPGAGVVPALRSPALLRLVDGLAGEILHDGAASTVECPAEASRTACVQRYVTSAVERLTTRPTLYA
jgi:hypothetical protein